MIYPSDDQPDSAESGATQSSAHEPTQTLGERVETVTAPKTVLEHRRGEAALALSEITPDVVDPSVQAVVGVRLYPGKGMLVEYLESSADHDPSLGLYPGCVWVRRRDVSSRVVKTWIAVSLAVTMATLTAALLLPLGWVLPVALGVALGTVLMTIGLLRVAVRMSPWWRLDEVYWTNLLRLSQRWSDEGVDQSFILARMHAAIVDAGHRD